MNKIEIPVNSKEEAIIAEAGGADRLEISLKNESGGVTPTLDEISDVIANTTLPCYLLIRPSEESYQVSDQEFSSILHYIEIARMTKVKGISVGVLKNGKVDKEKLEKIIESKGSLELVFNHAIDSTYDYEEELNYLLEKKGVDWIQTSGSARTIFDGYERLMPFLDRLKTKLIIGKTINVNNISKLIDAGFNDIIFQAKDSLLIGDNYSQTLSIDKIKEFVKAVKGEEDE